MVGRRVLSAQQARFEAGERKRAALEEFLRQGFALRDALERVDLRKSTYEKYRQTYPQWRERWDRAKLVGRDARNGLLTAGRVDPADDPSLTHVPASFTGFVQKFFPDRDPPMRHQEELADALMHLREREVVLFLLWPGAGKTSVVEDYICRTLALDPDHRFRVVSSSDHHAVRMVDQCKRRFTETETWPEFIARFGPFYEPGQERSGKPWSSHALTVWKSSGKERDRSLQASGWTGATLGSRIDTLIWDDVQTPENLNEAPKIFDRLRSTYFSRGRGMRTIIIGNRCGRGDLYERLEDAGLITRIVYVPATGAFGAEPGHPSVPEWWDQHELVHEKGGPCCGGRVPFRECPDNGKRLTPLEYVGTIRHQVGEAAWWSLWQQQPASDELTTFGRSLDGCLDTTRKIGDLAA